MQRAVSHPMDRAFCFLEAMPLTCIWMPTVIASNDEILDSLRNDEQLSPPTADWPAAIYHYTSESALSSILCSQSLWATSPAFLNDSTDSDHHMAIIRRALPAKFALATEFPEIAAKKAQEFLARCYVCSFCSVGDALSLWRAYGDNTRGFALAIKPQLLVEAPIVDWLKLAYLPMRYWDEATCERLLNDREAAALKALGLSTHAGVDRDLAFHLLLQGQTDSVSIKHPAFDHEGEHRFLLMDTRKRELIVPGTDAPDQRLQGKRVVAYRRIPLPRDAVAGVVVGPGRNFESSEAQLTMMLQRYGFDPATVPITKSTIPWA